MRIGLILINSAGGRIPVNFISDQQPDCLLLAQALGLANGLFCFVILPGADSPLKSLTPDPPHRSLFWTGSTRRIAAWILIFALLAQSVERIHGKDEVTSSNLVEGSGTDWPCLPVREIGW